MTSVPPDLLPSDLERLFSAERLSTYVDHCDGDFNAAIGMYRWNAAITAAFWEPIGHLEVALRNTIDARLAARHDRLDRQGSWLGDPERELGDRARLDIASARDRVRQKGKRASDGQTISELSFGFWRFLVAKKLTGLWPDLASGFPYAPDRRLATVEGPLARLHVFRNRLAHHQRVWSHAPEERYEDLLALAGYIDPALPAWISATSTVPQTLTDRPVSTRRRSAPHGRHPANQHRAAAEDLARAGGQDALIEIVEYDETWPAVFEAERTRLAPLLGGAEIHHFGSTAVPGLAAKPVIDMIALVDDLDAPIRRLVERAGYQFPVAYNETLPHRRFLCYPTAAHRTHHLHLVDDADELTRRLRFRDCLRADPTLAAEYAMLKRDFAARYRDDREAYTDAKAPFVKRWSAAP